MQKSNKSRKHNYTKNAKNGFKFACKTKVLHITKYFAVSLVFQDPKDSKEWMQN